MQDILLDAADRELPERSLDATLGTVGGLAVAVSVTGCGGGGSSTAAAPPPAPVAPTEAQAARFLLQAGIDASPTDIDQVRRDGYAAWLDGQLARPPEAPTRYDWMVAQGYAVADNLNNFAGADASSWRKLIGGTDPVRQRMTLALSELLVVSMAGLPIPWRGLAIAHYADLLEAHAFGNFRDLLEAVTLSPAMGVYLNMRGNRRDDPATGRLPDENYAREIMQLFTIGLVELNADGSLRLSNGQPVDSYSQDDISQLARVFTGWDFDAFQRDDYAYVKRPMAHVASRFQPGDKRVLGHTIAAASTGPQALRQALDILFNHANTGPFVARQLIQRFTQSNPSGAYVGRVAAVFANNGQGVRGDLKATLRALLLDEEARAEPHGNASGKLREPVLRLVQLLRTFGVRSASERWAVGDTSDPATRLGQCPWRSPTVFNFYRPGYIPPGGDLGQQRITAPEFQLCNESTVAGYLNYLSVWVTSGVGDMRLDLASWLPVAADAAALVDRLNRRLAADQISLTTRNAMVTALNTLPATTDTERQARVRAALILVMASPEYQVIK